MTYVEFFDTTSVRNICSCLAAEPDKVIFVGSDAKNMHKYAEIYQRVFAEKGRNIRFEVKPVIFKNIESAVSTLCEIVEENGECVFDLEGGEETVLVAMGMVYERYRGEGIKLQRISILSNTVRVGGEERNVSGLSVNENIRIYGGEIVYDDRNPEGTHRWEMTEEFCRDIDAAWNICKQDVGYWNKEIKDLQLADKYRNPGHHPLYTYASFKNIGSRINIGIIPPLCKAGLIKDFRCDNEGISYQYKNQQVKQLLSKAGQVLEMKVYATALSVTDDRGKPVYDDAMNGVCIDWDGDESEQNTVENEIDVMMTRGVVPVFVSCKNGAVDVNELYKLNTVAKRFGGEYARKVLIATALDRSGAVFAEFFRDRAESMGIRLIDDFHTMSDGELLKTIKNLWRT